MKDYKRKKLARDLILLNKQLLYIYILNLGNGPNAFALYLK